MKTEYPHLVLRIMPTIYCRCPIVFKDKDGGRDKPNRISGTNKPLVIIDNQPYDKKGKLTKKAKDEVILTALKEAKRIGFRVAVVFSRNRCVFCELDGTTKESKISPDGVTMIKVRGCK